MTNFCIKCKYFRGDRDFPSSSPCYTKFAKCHHPKFIKYNPVSGAVEAFYCETHRKIDGLLDVCGTKGDYFVDKDSIIDVEYKEIKLPWYKRLLA